MKKILMIFILMSLNSLYSEIIDLNKAIELGLENNRILKKSEINKDTSKKLSNSYRTNFLPKVSFNANYLLREKATSLTLDGGYLPTYSPDANGELQPNLLIGGDGNLIYDGNGNPVFTEYAFMPDITAEVLPKKGFIAGFSLKQPLFMGGKIFSAYKISKIGLSISDLQLSKAREDLIIEVSDTYWQVLSVKEKLKTAKEYNEMLENLVIDVENAVETGLRTRNDLLKAKLKFNETELMVKKAENGVNLSKMLLSQKIGIEQDSYEISDYDFTEGKISKSVFDNFDIENRLDYQILEKSVKVSQEKVRIARADFLPEIGLQADYSHLEYELNDKTNESDGYTIIANLSVPIFEWFDSFHKVGIAKNDHKNSKLDFDNYKELMKIDIQKNLFDYEVACKAYDIANLSVKQAEENLRIVNNNYEVGRETLTELLDAQASWQEVKMDLIEAVKNKEIAYLKYQKSVGTLINEH